MSHDHLCVTLVPLFNYLPIEDQLKINALVYHQVFEKGEQVITPDSEAKLVIVAKGNMKVYQLSASGREQLLRVVEPGGHEGENMLFGVYNENLFAEALEKTEVCVLRQQDFQNLLLKYPAISLKLLAFNAEKSNGMEQQTQFLLMERVEERLAKYLLDLAKVKGEDSFQLPMKMKELAAFLGTTPETLSRKFRLLEDEGLVERERRVVRLLDGDGLEDI